MAETWVVVLDGEFTNRAVIGPFASRREAEDYLVLTDYDRRVARLMMPPTPRKEAP